jgi:hypothetical protein
MPRPDPEVQAPGRRYDDDDVSPEQLWRCPLCGALAESGPEHLREQHDLGRPAEDRFGLRAALPRDPTPLRQRSRPRRPARRPDSEAEPPPRPVPIPPDAAVLRLCCETLEGRDAGSLQADLAALQGVESVAVDLYAGTIDLFLDRRRAAPPHLVAVASERFGLPLKGAALHRHPRPGSSLGEETRLVVLF